MASLDMFQQVYALSTLTNKLFNIKGDNSAPNYWLQKQIQNDLSYYVTVPNHFGILHKGGRTQSPEPSVVQVLGTWDVAWGPVVFQSAGSNVADNVMCVYHCANAPMPDGTGTLTPTDTYVVAIAGTAAMSAFDWQDEDEAVTGVVPASTLAPGMAMPTPVKSSSIDDGTTAYVSLGTAMGVYELLSMVPPTLAAPFNSPVSAGKTLAQFLSGLGSAANSSTIVFTGHSLGGALSPALAWCLKANGVLSNFKAAHFYATAGASPGNALFASQLQAATAFPVTQFTSAPNAKPYWMWNGDFWNTYDVVPHAWSTNGDEPRNLTVLTTIYGNNAKNPAPQQVVSMQAELIANSQQSDITYTPILGASFQGELVSNTPPATLDAYVDEVIHQHLVQYGAFIGTTALMPSYKADLLDGVSQESKLEMALFYKKLFAEKPVFADA